MEMKIKNLLFYNFLFSVIACASQESEQNNEDSTKEESKEEVIETPTVACGQFSEPGRYKVKPCDLFVGTLGVNFEVKKIDEYDQIRGNYIDERGNILLAEEVFGTGGWEIAHYGLKLYSEEAGIMTVTNNAKDLYDRCLDFLRYSPEADPANHCSLVSPTEALDGEAIVRSEHGYYGKTNDQTYPQLAECAARDLDSVVFHTSKFLELPPLNQGISLLHIFKDKTPSQTGLTVFSVSAWFYKKDDLEAVNYAVTECEEKISAGKFSKGDHELTHVFVGGFGIPFTFNEGLANYVPRVLGEAPEGWNTKGEQWNTAESVCKEDGFQKGYGLHSYIKHYDDPRSYDSYVSGECFWQKLVYDNGQEIIPKVMGVLKNNVGKNKTFEESLKEAGAEITKYKAWGLGE